MRPTACRRGFRSARLSATQASSEGQLESEIKGRSWIIKKPDDAIADVDACSEKLWGDQLRTMGPFYQMLADSPDDPSLN